MLNSSNHPNLPSGLVDKGVEFFVHHNDVMCLHNGQVLHFREFPDEILQIIEADMLKSPEALKALSEWENLDELDRVRQYIYCRFGGFDNEPDITSKGVIDHAEYFDCGLRGKCRYEGKLCRSIKVENGILTKTEIEVIKRVQLLDKQIADELNISPETVSSHWQNIRQKTAKRSKVELAVFAHQKNLI